MLPPGTKSLTDIAKIPDPEVRIGLYGTLLEWVLKSLPAGGAVLQTLDTLIDCHRDKFRDFRSVDGARWVRNQLVHSTGNASPARIRTADADFDPIIRGLAEQYCSQDVRDAALGLPKPAPPPVTPPKLVPDVHAPVVSTAIRPITLSPPPPPQPKSSAGWGILGGVFLALAVAFLVYEQPTLLTNLRQPPPPPPAHRLEQQVQTVAVPPANSATFTETFDNAPDPANNWTMQAQSGSPQITYTPGNFRIQAPNVCPTPNAGTSITYLTKQSFGGNIDVAFQLNHGGYGRTSVGLWSVNRNERVIEIDLDSDDTAYLNLASGEASTQSTYPSAPYMNTWITLRIQVVGDQATFYAENSSDSQALQTWPVPKSSPPDVYYLFFSVGSICWKSGANDTSLKSVSVRTGQLAPRLEGSLETSEAVPNPRSNSYCESATPNGSEDSSACPASDTVKLSDEVRQLPESTPKAGEGVPLPQRNGQTDIESLLERAQAGLGGRHAISSVRDSTSSSEVLYPDGRRVRSKGQFVAPSYRRQEIELFSGGKSVVYTDGSVGWMSTPNGITSMPLKTVQDLEFYDLSRLLLSDQDDSLTVLAKGSDSVTITARTGQAATLQFDSLTGLPVRLGYRFVGSNSEILPAIATFADWRSVAGLRFPSRMTIEVNGKLLRQDNVIDVKVNTGLTVADISARP